MKDILKLGGLLMLITGISATALAGIYSVTKPRIERQKQLVLENALTIALPALEKEVIFPVEKDGKIIYYEGFTTVDKTELVGYAFVAKGPGYSSVIETMVGVDTAGLIIGMQVLNQQETLMIMLEDLCRRNPAFIRFQRDGRTVRIRAGDHQHMIAFEPVITGENIGGQIGSGQMPGVHVAIGIGPGNRYMNIFRFCCH